MNLSEGNILATMRQITAKNYNIDLSKLDEDERRELMRFLFDVKSHIQSQKNIARKQAFRGPHGF